HAAVAARVRRHGRGARGHRRVRRRALMSAFGRDRAVRPVVVGFGAPPVGKHAPNTPDDLAETTLREALAGLDTPVSAVDGLYLVAAGYARTVAPLRPQRLAERLGVTPRAMVEVECGGAVVRRGGGGRRLLRGRGA